MSAGLALAALGLLALAAGRRRRSSAPSEREDVEPSDDTRGLPAWLAESIGEPYSWGGGSPASPWPDNAGKGWDCSGYVQAALVQLGLMDEDESDRTAQGLYDITADISSPELGDLAFYGTRPDNITHVMLCVGDGRVIGASGGTSSTHGDDPNARVKVFSSHLYRSDFIGYGRL